MLYTFTTYFVFCIYSEKINIKKSKINRYPTLSFFLKLLLIYDMKLSRRKWQRHITDLKRRRLRSLLVIILWTKPITTLDFIKLTPLQKNIDINPRMICEAIDIKSKHSYLDRCGGWMLSPFWDSIIIAELHSKPVITSSPTEM